MRQISIYFFSAAYLVVFVCVGIFPQAVDAHSLKKSISAEAFGANIHLHQRITRADQNDVLQQAQNVGVEWAREEFRWEDIEPSENAYTWDIYDDVIDAYDAHDIQVLGLLTYSTQWASSNPNDPDYEFYAPNEEAWRAYVRAVATRYAGRVNYWEIWNEPNQPAFWKSGSDAYADLLQASAEEIHSVNPNAKVVFGGVSGADSDFLNQTYTRIQNPSIIDVVAVHPYRERNGQFIYAPEQTIDGLNTLTTDLYNVLRVVRKNDDAHTPIWLTEVGWPTLASVGVSEQTQAQYLVRLYTQALAVPNVEKVFWYAFTDDAQDFGLFSGETYVAKPAADALSFAKKHLSKMVAKRIVLPEQRIVDHFSNTQTWDFAGTVCTEGTVQQRKQKLWLTYTFTQENNCYAPVVSTQLLPERTRAVEFWAKGSNDSAILRVRVSDASGETFQYTLGSLPNRFLPYVVEFSQFHDHWGGNNDAHLDMPLRFDSFIIQNTNNEMSNGNIVIDQFTASPAAQTYLYQFQKNGKRVHAYWSMNRSRKRQLSFSGKNELTIFSLVNGVEETNNSSFANGYATLTATGSVKFIQTQ